MRRLQQRLRFTEDELHERTQALSRQRQQVAASVNQAHQQVIDELREKLEQQAQTHAAAMAQLKTRMHETQAALKAKIIKQEQELRMFRDRVPGKGRSEKFSGDSLDSGKTSKPSARPRSKHGGGRKPHKELPAAEETLELPPDARCCPACGRLQLPLGNTEDSEEVDYQVRVVRIVRHRQKYAPCSCGRSGILTAPLPPKAMVRSKYSDAFWIAAALSKYDLLMPLERFIALLAAEGLQGVSSGTLSDGLGRLSNLLAPIDQAIIERNLASGFWSADETRLAVFNTPTPSGSYNWSIWQVQSPETVVYQATPTREAAEIQNYFAECPNGILLVDRASTYKTLWLALAFCWAHVRRDFIKVGRYVSGNRIWAAEWLSHIRKLYRLYSSRSRWREPESADFQEADFRLRKHLEKMARQRNRQLADVNLRQERRKVLDSMVNHWEGLTRFLDEHRLPLDNNHTERRFRPIAGIRKNSYGCHSEDAAHRMARMMTVIQTLKANHINPKQWMTDFLEATAQNHGQPPDHITPFLPWNYQPTR